MLYYTKVLYTMLSYIIVYDNCRIHFGTVEGFQASQTSGQDMHEEDDAKHLCQGALCPFSETPNTKPNQALMTLVH